MKLLLVAVMLFPACLCQLPALPLRISRSGQELDEGREGAKTREGKETWSEEMMEMDPA